MSGRQCDATHDVSADPCILPLHHSGPHVPPSDECTCYLGNPELSDADEEACKHCDAERSENLLCPVCEGAGWDWGRCADEDLQVDDPGMTPTPDTWAAWHCPDCEIGQRFSPFTVAPPCEHCNAPMRRGTVMAIAWAWRRVDGA